MQVVLMKFGVRKKKKPRLYLDWEFELAINKTSKTTNKKAKSEEMMLGGGARAPEETSSAR